MGADLPSAARLLTAGLPAGPGLLPGAGLHMARLLPHGNGTPPVTLPRDPARDAARRELSKRMYHDGDPGLLRRALNAFWTWVQDLFLSAAGVTPGGGFGLFVIVLAVLALAGALWWRLGTPRRTRVAAGRLFEDGPRSAAQHRAAAEAHAAQGRWSEAVQERMRAIVRALEERALLDPRPGRTADEAAAEAAASLPVHSDRLHAAARDFDDVAYGGRSGDEDTYQRLSALDDELARTRPVPAVTGPQYGGTTAAGAAGSSDATRHFDHASPAGSLSRRAPE